MAFDTLQDVSLIVVFFKRFRRTPSWLISIERALKLRSFPLKIFWASLDFTRMSWMSSCNLNSWFISVIRIDLTENLFVEPYLTICFSWRCWRRRNFTWIYFNSESRFFSLSPIIFSSFMLLESPAIFKRCSSALVPIDSISLKTPLRSPEVVAMDAFVKAHCSYTIDLDKTS